MHDRESIYPVRVPDDFFLDHKKETPQECGGVLAYLPRSCRPLWPARR